MKKTRRFIAGLSALAMASVLAPMSAFAANETGSTDVSYIVTPSYTVNIPAGVTLDSENSVSANIEASNVIIESKKKIQVALTEASNTASGSNFSAKTEKGDSTATYTISKGETAVAVGDVVAEFTAAGTQALTFSKASGATHAGTHTETLTFGISVESAITTRTVTWNASDIVTDQYATSFTKDGITFAPGMGDFKDKSFAGGGTFTTASGKFTKIEVTAASVNISGTGWSGGTWTGDASTSVSYSGDIMDMGHGMFKIVFTIEE